METDGALDVEEMEKENRCMQRSESKINTSPSGEPLEGEISVTLETVTAGSAPGGPLMAGVGYVIPTSNPREDSPRITNEAALACGTSVKTHVPDVDNFSNQDENCEAEVKAKGTNFDDNVDLSSDEIERLTDVRNSLTDSMDFDQDAVEQMLSDISHDPQKPASIVSDMEVIEDEIELRGAGMTSENATDRDPESEKEEVQNSDVSNSVESVEDATKFEAAETCDFIVSNDLIDVKTSLVEVMGKPLPKFCVSSASVVATSCNEENILKENQVPSPGDCENLSTECTESNDELTGLRGNPGIFILVAYAMANFLQVEMQRVKMLLLKPYMMKNHRKMPQVRHCVTY